MSVMTDNVRILLVDDQELVRSGLKRILRPREGLEVVAECSDGGEIDETLADITVDVVVMDLRMRHVDGIEATRRLVERGDNPPVLVLTTFDDDELLSGALRAGAAGFVLKDAPADDLIRAVRCVASGQSWLDPSITARVLNTYRAAPAPADSGALDVLTPRELEVLTAIGRGRTNAEIAEDMNISELTVKSHIGRVFAKLDLRDRAAAIVLAYEQGLAGQ